MTIQDEGSKNFYFPTINFLRGIAALMVACYHFSNFSDNGATLLPQGNIIRSLGGFGNQGVIIFFVISGFVIPMSMFKGKYTLARLGKFLLKRSLRIEPPYIASILLLFLINLYYTMNYGWPYHIEWRQLLYHILYVIPFTHYEWYNVIYWTLALEIQYYLLMSFIFPLLASERWNLRYIGIVIVSMSALVISDDRFIFHFLPVFGIGVYLFLYRIGKITVHEWLILTLIGVSVIFKVHQTETVVASLAALLFIQLTHFDYGITNRLGEISYSLYLTHGMVGNKIIWLYYKQSNSLMYKYGLLLFALLASLAFARLFWWLIEGPSSRLSKKIKLKS